jgi:hypothetical protein
LEGINTDTYERSGQLFCITAEDLLAKFIPDGVLDEDLFKSTIGRLIEKASSGKNDGHCRKVRIFGEMVSQLRDCNLKATTRLEELWNEVIKEYSVALLCTYALNDQSDHIPEALVQLHSQSIERESDVA